jgi:Zn-dependent M32 family carboxypeptidase
LLLCGAVCVLSQVLLDDYEKGMTSARLDQIFQEVRWVEWIDRADAEIGQTSDDIKGHC